MEKLIKYLSLSLIISLAIASNVFCNLYQVNDGEANLGKDVIFQCEEQAVNCEVTVLECCHRKRHKAIFKKIVPVPVKQVIYQESDKKYVGLILNDGRCFIYNMRDYQARPKMFFLADYQPIVQAYANSNEKLYIRYRDNKVAIFDIPTGKKLNDSIQLKRKRIVYESYIPNIRYFIIRYHDNSYEIVNMSTWEQKRFQVAPDKEVKNFTIKRNGSACIIEYKNRTFEIINIIANHSKKIQLTANPANIDKEIVNIYFGHLEDKSFIIEYKNRVFEILGYGPSKTIIANPANIDKEIFNIHFRYNYFIIKYKNHTFEVLGCNPSKTLTGNPAGIVNIYFRNDHFIIEYRHRKFHRAFQRIKGNKTKTFYPSRANSNKQIKRLSIINGLLTIVYQDDSIEREPQQQQLPRAIQQRSLPPRATQRKHHGRPYKTETRQRRQRRPGRTVQQQQQTAQRLAHLKESLKNVLGKRKRNACIQTEPLKKQDQDDDDKPPRKRQKLE